VRAGRHDAAARALQPFSQKSRTPTVAKEFQIGLCGVVEADLELFCNSWRVGFLGERLYPAAFQRLCDQVYEDGRRARWTFGWSGLLACFTAGSSALPPADNRMQQILFFPTAENVVWTQVKHSPTSGWGLCVVCVVLECSEHIRERVCVHPTRASSPSRHPEFVRRHHNYPPRSGSHSPTSPPPRYPAIPAQWRLTGGGTQMPFSAMWTHIRVWNLRVRGHTGRFFLQSYVKRTSGAVSTLTTEGRSSSRRDASGAIKKCVLVAPES